MWLDVCLHRFEDCCTGKILIPDLFRKLRSLDIRSVMVEGGASVIASLLAEAPLNKEDGGLSSIVDTVIVTVAPTFVGDDGVGYGIGLRSDQVRESPLAASGSGTLK
jgi:2,5-diamino-6-(ribosylamino)-4(3H)-pyrimidinone 5'-phosphate reductase